MAVSTSRLDNIAVVTIDRPQHRNAVDHATAQQLANGLGRRRAKMKFMEAEFDYADKSKNGQLDPNELKRLVFKVNHPYTGTPRVGK